MHITKIDLSVFNNKKRIIVWGTIMDRVSQSTLLDSNIHGVRLSYKGKI